MIESACRWWHRERLRRRKPGPVIYAAKYGAKGGTRDDTQALQHLITYAPDWSTIIVNDAAAYRLSDMLDATTKQGLIITSLMGSPAAGLSSVSSYPQFIANNDLPGFIQFGSLGNLDENYNGLRYSSGIQGIALNANGKRMLDAAVVMEASQYPIFNAMRLFNGHGRVLRLRCVWDEEFDRVKLLSWNNDGGDLVYLDDVYNSDPNGNVNHIYFHRWQTERFTGTAVRGHPKGNQFKLAWRDCKWEASNLKPTHDNDIIDLQNAYQCSVHENFFHAFTKANHWQAMVRFNGGIGNSVIENKMSKIDAAFLVNGPGARMTRCKSNTSTDNEMVPEIINESQYTADLDGVICNRIDYNFFGEQEYTAGWRSIHRFGRSTAPIYVPDGSCLNGEKAALREPNVAWNTILASLPVRRWRDSPTDLHIRVRCRPTTDPGNKLAILQLKGKGGATLMSAKPERQGWQVVTLTATVAQLENMGDSGSDRFRIEYGWDNAQPIDLDVLRFDA